MLQQINKADEVSSLTKSQLEKALLMFYEESKLAYEEKMSQNTLVFTKLVQEYDEISSKYAATRKELKKILLSMSLTLNPIKPEKLQNKFPSRGGVKTEAPLEIEVCYTVICISFFLENKIFSTFRYRMSN
jgi:hypothetical protein